MQFEGFHIQFRAIQDPKHTAYFLVNFESWWGKKKPVFCPDSMGHFMYSGHADMIKRMHIHDF